VLVPNPSAGSQDSAQLNLQAATLSPLLSLPLKLSPNHKLVISNLEGFLVFIYILLVTPFKHCM
jgi:hypothetical protein